MSLDNKPKGNPNWVPGKSGNPDGRPKGAKSLKGILKVAATLAEKKRHPVEELIRIADHAENFPATGGKELAAKIWADLLKYCEPQKKPVETAPEKPTTPEESKKNAEEAMKYLQELENGTSGENPGSASGHPPRMADGSSSLSPEASSTPDLPSDKGV